MSRNFTQCKNFSFFTFSVKNHKPSEEWKLWRIRRNFIKKFFHSFTAQAQQVSIAKLSPIIENSVSLKTVSGYLWLSLGYFDLPTYVITATAQFSVEIEISTILRYSFKFSTKYSNHFNHWATVELIAYTPGATTKQDFKELLLRKKTSAVARGATIKIVLIGMWIGSVWYQLFSLNFNCWQTIGKINRLALNRTLPIWQRKPTIRQYDKSKSMSIGPHMFWQIRQQRRRNLWQLPMRGRHL